MRTTMLLFWTFILAFSLSFAGIISCGCGDDDSSSGSEQIDDDESCFTCGITAECTAAFGPGWACCGGCCVEVGDDDVNDDVNDDVDDDTGDDVNDDVDDDIDDDVNDDVDDDISPPSCEGEQVNNGPLDVDNDGDGYSEDFGDCNDAVNAVNPYATEVFDGVDNNCDGIIDEDFDEDCDGYQSEETGGDDCVDNDYLINPGAADDELVFIDLNCDGVIGDAASGDADADGFALFGTSGAILDCDDADPLTNAGAPELPDDGIDNNCDGEDLVLSDETGVFVATTGDNSNPGTMAAPKRTIGAGANLAFLAGKSVFVAQGDYSEEVEPQVSLFGGYESTGWTRNMDLNVTTISAATSTAVIIRGSNPVAIQGFTIHGGSETTYSTRGVYIFGGSTVTLTNNIIAGGSPTGGNSSSFGVSNYKGTATLVNNIINGESGDDYYCGVRNSQDLVRSADNNTLNGRSPSGRKSYGVRNYDGKVTLTNNIINGGSSGYSYGVRNSHDSVTSADNNTLDGRSTTGTAARSYGVYSEDGTATLTNNVIDGGSKYYSYGVYNDDGTATLVNNTIDGGSGSSRSYGVSSAGTATLANNTISGGSGSSCNGVYISGTATLVNNVINGGLGYDSYGVYNHDGTATLVNNTIDGGSGSDYSNGVINGGTTTLVNNDIWGADMNCLIYQNGCQANTIGEVNTCAWTGCEEASGNISDDPLFVNPSEGDFHLQNASPCIDAGIDPVPDYIGSGLVDFDFEGDARPFGAGWDIGVDEWTP